MKKSLLSTVSSIALSVMIITSIPNMALAQTVTPPTAAQIKEYVLAHVNEPAKIAAAMKEYNVNLDQIQAATGYTREQMHDYITKSNSTELKSYLANWAVPTVTNQQVDEYIRANLSDPAKIAAAMSAYNVDMHRVRVATGFTPTEMKKYVRDANIPELTAHLTKWESSQFFNPNTVVVPKENFEKLPDYMKGSAPGSGQQTITIRDSSEIDKLDIWTGMSAAEIERTKGNIRFALAGGTSGYGVTTMGVNGLQVIVPGPNASQRQYPPLTARDAATIRTEIDALKATRPADNVAEIKALADCRVAEKPSCATEERNLANKRQSILDIDARVAQTELSLLNRTGTATLEQRYNAAQTAQSSAYSAFIMCMSATASSGKDCRAQGELALAKDNEFRRALSDVKNQQCGSSPKQGLASCAAYRDVLETDFADQSNRIKKLFEGVERGTEASRVEAYATVIGPTIRTVTPAPTPTAGTATPTTGTPTPATTGAAPVKATTTGTSTTSSANNSGSGADAGGARPGVKYAIENGRLKLKQFRTTPSTNVPCSGVKGTKKCMPITKSNVPQPTDAEINEYIRTNLSEPAKIVEAMKKHNVGLDRIQQALGYTRQEMVDYINRSNSPLLKEHLKSWSSAVPERTTWTPEQINAVLRRAGNNSTAALLPLIRNEGLTLDDLHKVWTADSLPHFVNSVGRTDSDRDLLVSLRKQLIEKYPDLYQFEASDGANRPYGREVVMNENWVAAQNRRKVELEQERLRNSPEERAREARVAERNQKIANPAVLGGNDAQKTAAMKVIYETEGGDAAVIGAMLVRNTVPLSAFRDVMGWSAQQAKDFAETSGNEYLIRQAANLS